jgi:hypothetical protein
MTIASSNERIQPHNARPAAAELARVCRRHGRIALTTWVSVRELLGERFQLRLEKATSFYRKPDGEAAWQTFATELGICVPRDYWLAIGTRV